MDGNEIIMIGAMIAPRTAPHIDLSLAFGERSAEISECGKYRYTLTRIWDNDKPKCMFIMLNPSKADATEDDATIRRCIGFAADWGFGGIYVCNLFAYRSTNPKELLSVDNPFGDKNIWHIAQIQEKVETVVLAWGNEPIVDKFFTRVGKRPMDTLPIPLRKFHYLKLTKGGTCSHPLYLPKGLKPIKMF